MKKSSEKAGLPPGVLLHVGEKKTESVRIRVMDYTADRLEEKELESIEQSFAYADREGVTWINIDGLHETDIIQKTGDHFGLHPLVLEDIVHTEQRPKVEDYEDHVFIVTKMLFYDKETSRLGAEQFSLVLGPNYVITFQEKSGNVFNPLRDRLRKAKGRIRKAGADYLMYALLDAIVDNYFIVLEKIGEEVEILDDGLIEDPNPEILQMIHTLKRELIYLRKSVWPLREVIGNLERRESKFVQQKTTVFLRDVYDHTIQVIEATETLRDIVSGMLDVYLSSISNRMNEVMKLLTIIATIFIPLTFIAGIYGMNFKYMPELEMHWGYPVALGVMLVIFVGMVAWFKRKKII